ncbi:MAG: AMP-binding protein [Pseudomonadota bacterium]
MSSLHQTIADRLFRAPDHVVVGAFETASALTARELVHLIMELGAGPLAGTKRIGVLSNQRPEAIIAVLGCFFAGATFVPLNPKFPKERLRKVARLAGVELILCDQTTSDLAEDFGLASVDISKLRREAFPAAEPQTRLSVPDTSQPAYMMFTSGTTGDPKGVSISHKNLASYVAGITSLIDFPCGARFSQLFDLSFDLAMHDIFVCFATGGTLVMPTALDLMMPAAYVRKKKIDVWFSVPALAASAGKSPGKEGDHTLSLALFCGEMLPRDYARSVMTLCAPDAEIWNLYGPTEATIAFTAHRFDEAFDTAPDVPIGHGFGANQTALLESDGTVNEAPDPGSEGELLLAGPQVFGGYEPQHASPFLSVNGTSYYRTGDRVSVSPKGYHFRQRMDDQLKVRGFRVEAAEIEAACRAHLSMDEVAAIVAGDESQTHIIAFYTGGDSKPEPTPLEAYLPDYMIPRAFHRLEKMPRNANGKTDRKALKGLLS